MSARNGDIESSVHLGFACSRCPAQIRWPWPVTPINIFTDRAAHTREAAAVGWTFYASRTFHAYCPQHEPTPAAVNRTRSPMRRVTPR
jgi:hypothetical protein